MSFINKIKEFFLGLKATKTQKSETPNYISINSMEMKYDNGDFMEAAKELKSLLEIYGRRKRKNHRYKGREFIYFILSNKHKDLKTIGYTHWQNLTQFIKLNQVKVYPYHQKNLREAMTFFEKEIKGLSEIKIPFNQ